MRRYRVTIWVHGGAPALVEVEAASSDEAWLTALDRVPAEVARDRVGGHIAPVVESAYL